MAFVFPINEPFIREQKLIYQEVEYGTVRIEATPTAHYLNDPVNEPVPKADLLVRIYFIRNEEANPTTLKTGNFSCSFGRFTKSFSSTSIDLLTGTSPILLAETDEFSTGVQRALKLYFKATFSFKVNGNNKTVSFPEEVYTVPYPAEKIEIITASDFTDEDNPTITHTGGSYPTNTTLPRDLKAIISFDGVTEDIVRDIEVSDNPYTFELTEEERELLRIKAATSPTIPITFRLKTTKLGETGEEVVYSEVSRNLTIVGCNPSANPIVKDINEKTLALTGDENTFVRYESTAEFAINAVASKYATIVTQSVQCGSKTIEGLPNGIIDDIESGTFIFYVLDSRGMAASTSVFKNLVEYVKPTCYQKLEIALSGETGATINLTVNGNYYSGSFGAVDNTLKLEVRHTDDNGDMGAWKTISGTPTYNNSTYKVETTLTGFNYGKAYVFQCRATDKLNVVQSAEYTIRLLPVFDWGENDFNFNVPVNIDAEDLSMHGETIIRHSETTNNTVLSASDGNIYIRPGGTDDTSGETIFYANGNVKFNGTVTFADGTTGGGAADPTDSFADYVIEIGEDSMGSNGTWYWRKWNSGKAEAWGCRNFGNMAVTTAWGNLYRGAILTQDLPYNVFIRTPDAININIVHSNYGGWICKHEQTAPSADTTGSFIFVRPASATVTPTNIGFYIVGEWQ